mmetsp:Transcript_75622/g.191232  ORF Transcript_75622/g.191232 Transcript_75622/m.191232 type:complete len:709 (-) Transcript_75622:391-2517(-)
MQAQFMPSRIKYTEGVVNTLATHLDPTGSGGIDLDVLLSVVGHLHPSFGQSQLRDELLKFRQGTTLQIDYAGFFHWVFGPSEVELRQNFAACDVNGDNWLTGAELRFALQACGLFPTQDQLSAAVGAARSSKVDFREYADLQARLVLDPEVKKNVPAVPYARRGLSLEQLQQIYEAFMQDGWLQKQCDDHNIAKRAEIAASEAFAYDENLYALDHFLVRKVTHTEKYNDVPQHLRMRARLPEPSHKSSYSELVNPSGLIVQYFVSHYWGHLFARTLKALQAFASSCPVGPSSIVVFWICLFALNQHAAAEEVGSSPEEGPFNAALAKAVYGVIMVLDECTHPLKRIWCLYEVQRTSDFKKRLTLSGECGPLDKDVDTLKRISDALEDVRAIDANASRKKDRLAILQRIVNPSLRGLVGSHLKRWLGGWADGRELQEALGNFDASVAKILAACLLPTALRTKDQQLALRCLGWGACERDTKTLQQVAGLFGGMPALAQTWVRTKWAHAPKVSLLAVAARCGDVEGAQLLLEAKAGPEPIDEYGVSPIRWAAEAGHVQIVRLLHGAGANLELTDTVRRATPAHWAAVAGHVQMLQLLSQAGASLEMPDKDKAAPVIWAAFSGHTQVLQFLNEWGAGLEAPCQHGTNAAHFAARSGHTKVIQLLCSLRCNMEVTDKAGRTPTDWASIHGHEEVVTLLGDLDPRTKSAQEDP